MLHFPEIPALHNSPSAIDELKLTVLNEIPHLGLAVLGLLPPPAPEEGGLDVDELVEGVTGN